jgi:nucleotide-binding universal stress UspA family protein
MTEVLVTTDGSDRSRHVLPHAARLAAETHQELRLVRVLDPLLDAANVVTPSLDDALAEVKRSWEPQLRAMVAESGPGTYEIATRKHGENVSGTILRVATDCGATIIALDTRGSGALRHALLGSTAMEVAGAGRFPVFLTGQHVHEVPSAPGYHILAAYDGSQKALGVLRALEPLLTAATVRLSVLTVVKGVKAPLEPQGSDSELEAVRSALPAGFAFDFVVHPIPPGGGIDAAIVNQAVERNAHAIALSSHGHSAGRHIFAGSTAMGILGQSPLPVILAKSEK